MRQIPFDFKLSKHGKEKEALRKTLIKYGYPAMFAAGRASQILSNKRGREIVNKSRR